MKRLAEKRILTWKNSDNRKPLIIRGARQVGKTWLVKEVLAKEFEHFAMVDLETRRDLHRYFERNLVPGDILNGIEQITGHIEPGKTLLFLDEIQACPRAITALRYFYEEMPELHVVAAGSMLEFAFSEISVPVGRVQYLHIYPMTFYEYLLATGRETMADATLKCQKDVDPYQQEDILEELRKYFFIGGMPEAVKRYKDTGSLVKVFETQSEILDSYRDDFAKYTPRVDITCLDEVFLAASKSVGEQIKYARLCDSFTGVTNHKAFDLLVKAKVLHKVPSCDPSGLPLGASARQKKFKACMLDIGLLQRLCQVPVDIEMNQKDLLAIYRGQLAEQFVGQEMLAWHNRELYYWARGARGSSAEVDYLTVIDGEIYPVEVKSGPSGKLRSMHQMLKEYPNCPGGFVLYSGTYEQIPEQKITFLPLYAVATIGSREQVML